MPPKERPASAVPSRMRTSRVPSSMAGRRPAAPTRAASVLPITSTSNTTRGPPVSRPGSVASGSVSRGRSPNSQVAGIKRKERDYEEEAALATNINVVVRCRGRNDREVKENSTVVVRSDKTVGKSVELSMGANALSNKTYTFDRVFSPAASQAMVFDEVVAPFLDQMLHGFNCTIFAYGQTGTGKTYTMSGDMSDGLGLRSDAAGIIPRVLDALFRKLDVDEPKESSVKCSFIELYNEELRDLIALDENAKLKIFDQEKKGHISTVVQGMEEAHIKNAEDGLRRLQLGNERRQVAATKCNDLSSRSHTVFTITVYTKHITESGEELVNTGKLNLVDLAGSENIGRSGAENKRATEAGLINKSLLTLGRVINALVDKGSHIPYRESKLTRLLQDSLGGRTKTCIIATVSPAKSNLEETMSTLDYAFRAKNIRNKPQVNHLLTKHTLLREFTAEIQQLKGELIMTRNRHGVHLPLEQYEEMTGENESLKVLSDEQRAKLEIQEDNLRNKTQELLDLTSDFLSLKQDNEGTRKALSDKVDVLEQTEAVLADVKQVLADETLIRKAHQSTERELAAKGEELISTLGRTVKDVSGLHDKLRRRSGLQALNRSNWQSSQNQVSSVTRLVEGRIADFQTSQRDLIEQLSSRVTSFVAEELMGLEEQKVAVNNASANFETLHAGLADKSVKGHAELDSVLEDINESRNVIKEKLGDGLHGLSSAAGHIAEGIIEELGSFHTQLHRSYSSLGDDFKSLFEQLNNQLVEQKNDAHRLRDELAAATEAAQKRNEELSSKFEASINEEKEQRSKDSAHLLARITELVQNDGEAQQQRLQSKLEAVRSDLQVAHAASSLESQLHQQSLDLWTQNEAALQSSIQITRDALQNKMQGDWLTVEASHAKITSTTRSVHTETVRIVDEQMSALDVQMTCLDDVLAKAKTQSEVNHDTHIDSLKQLNHSQVVTHETSLDAVDAHWEAVSGLDDDMSTNISAFETARLTLNQAVNEPLTELRETILGAPLAEYAPTGETPQKRHYIYPKSLPRTAAHEQVLARGEPLTIELPAFEATPASAPASPSKEKVLPDADSSSSSNAYNKNRDRATLSPVSPRKQRVKDEGNNTMPVTLPSLRELDTNIVAAPPLLTRNSDSKVKGGGILGKKHKIDYDSNTAPVTMDISLSKSALREMGPPPLKKLATEGNKGRSVSGRKPEGRENLPLDKAARRTLRSSVRS